MPINIVVTINNIIHIASLNLCSITIGSVVISIEAIVEVTVEVSVVVVIVDLLFEVLLFEMHSLVSQIKQNSRFPHIVFN